MEIKYAVIESFEIGLDDNELVMHILLKYNDRSLQTFGNIVRSVNEDNGNYQKQYLNVAYFIEQCLKITECYTIDKMIGKSVRVQMTNLAIEAIGSEDNLRWFNPKLCDYGNLI